MKKILLSGMLMLATLGASAQLHLDLRVGGAGHAFRHSGLRPAVAFDPADRP